MKKGFTLIELLVVVLIIGILSAVALPQYRKAVLKARAAEGLTLLRSIEKAEDVYFMANGQYTMDLEALDLDLPKFKCSSTYCGFQYPHEVLLWEINGNTSSYTLYCAANSANEAAVQICQSFGTFSHVGGWWSYYVVVRKSGGKTI